MPTRSPSPADSGAPKQNKKVREMSQAFPDVNIKIIQDSVNDEGVEKTLQKLLNGDIKKNSAWSDVPKKKLVPKTKLTTDETTTQVNDAVVGNTKANNGKSSGRDRDRQQRTNNRTERNTDSRNRTSNNNKGGNKKKKETDPVQLVTRTQKEQIAAERKQYQENLPGKITLVNPPPKPTGGVWGNNKGQTYAQIIRSATQPNEAPNNLQDGEGEEDTQEEPQVAQSDENSWGEQINDDEWGDGVDEEEEEEDEQTQDKQQDTAVVYQQVQQHQQEEQATPPRPATGYKLPTQPYSPPQRVTVAPGLSYQQNSSPKVQSDAQLLADFMARQQKRKPEVDLKNVFVPRSLENYVDESLVFEAPPEEIPTEVSLRSSVQQSPNPQTPTPKVVTTQHTPPAPASRAHHKPPQDADDHHPKYQPRTHHAYQHQGAPMRTAHPNSTDDMQIGAEEYRNGGSTMTFLQSAQTQAQAMQQGTGTNTNSQPTSNSSAAASSTNQQQQQLPQHQQQHQPQQHQQQHARGMHSHQPPHSQQHMPSPQQAPNHHMSQTAGGFFVPNASMSHQQQQQQAPMNGMMMTPQSNGAANVNALRGGGGGNPTTNSSTATNKHTKESAGTVPNGISSPSQNTTQHPQSITPQMQSLQAQQQMYSQHPQYMNSTAAVAGGGGGGYMSASSGNSGGYGETYHQYASTGFEDGTSGGSVTHQQYANSSVPFRDSKGQSQSQQQQQPTHYSRPAYPPSHLQQPHSAHIPPFYPPQGYSTGANQQQYNVSAANSWNAYYGAGGGGGGAGMHPQQQQQQPQPAQRQTDSPQQHHSYQSHKYQPTAHQQQPEAAQQQQGYSATVPYGAAPQQNKSASGSTAATGAAGGGGGSNVTKFTAGSRPFRPQTDARTPNGPTQFRPTTNGAATNGYEPQQQQQHRGHPHQQHYTSYPTQQQQQQQQQHHHHQQQQMPYFYGATA